MNIRAPLRALERSAIRPISGAARRAWERLRGGSPDRVGRLERRVDELESLIRELTGLAYLRLAEEEETDDDRTAA